MLNGGISLTVWIRAPLSPWGRHLRIHEHHTRPAALMRCPREGDEHAEGTGGHVGSVIG